MANGDESPKTEKVRVTTRTRGPICKTDGADVGSMTRPNPIRAGSNPRDAPVRVYLAIGAAFAAILVIGLFDGDSR